jgi:integrase/recombinase XerD
MRSPNRDLREVAAGRTGDRWSARRALLRYVAGRDPIGPRDPLFVGRYDAPLSRRGIQTAIARLGRRAGGTPSSPHTFARSYLVNGGDVISLQQIPGYATLDMVRRYVRLSEADLVIRHRSASPADRLGRKVAAD